MNSYRDCSKGLCSIECPQWYYLSFPTPPPPPPHHHYSFFIGDDEPYPPSNFSPLLLAFIGVLLAAFLLVSYYTVIAKFCRSCRRDDDSSSAGDRYFSSGAGGDDWRHGAPEQVGDGLDEALIKSIKVYKYRKSDGLVDSSDCSVCLSEFEEDESLRLLPKCNHAFHVPCIDAWFKSHSNCPLCRSDLTAAAAVADHPISAAGFGNPDEGNADVNSPTVYRSGDIVVVIEDVESQARNETVGRSNNVQSARYGVWTRGGEEIRRMRRSLSLNSGDTVSIADTLLVIENDDEESGGIGTSQQRSDDDENGGGKATANQSNGVSSFLVRSAKTIKRSVSAGRFTLPRYDRTRNYRLPH